MRLFFLGPRFFGVRPGVSFSPRDLSAFFRAPQATIAPRIDGSFVYVIDGNNGHCKIGITTNPDARLASLRTASPHTMGFAFIGATPTNGFAIEREAHRILANCRAQGEWFACPSEMAIAAVAGSAARLGEKIQPVSLEQSRQILQVAKSASQPKDYTWHVFAGCMAIGVLISIALMSWLLKGI